MTVAEQSLVKKESRFPGVVRRDFAVYIALDLALDHTRTLDLAVARAYAIDRTRTGTGILDFDFDFDFNHALDRDFVHSCDIDFDSLNAYGIANNFSTDAILKIIDFLKAKVLILDSLEHDAFVSKNIRERILHDRLMAGEE